MNCVFFVNPLISSKENTYFCSRVFPIRQALQK
jgi:hypothetical protein